jgi:ABC-type transport system involved in multi-copper enzyme maturation permease subunit
MIAEMKMLLWKDYRLSRLCIVAGIIFILVPYLFYLDPYIKWYFEDAWMASTILSQLIIALLAGNIIACERADRSAAFLAYQGAPRKKVIASKLIICTIAFLSICAIYFVLSFWLKIRPEEMEHYREAKILAAATGFCFFGCCWLFSALFQSTIAAIVFGLLPAIPIANTLTLTREYLHWPDSNIAFLCWYVALTSAVGLISLVAGTWYFIRSKEA